MRDVEIDTGGIVAPFSAFLVLRGIATLAVRMDRHCQDALALARWLAAQAGGYPVVYPGLPDHPQAAVAQRQLRAGGGMLTLDVRSRRGRARVHRRAEHPGADRFAGQHPDARRPSADAPPIASSTRPAWPRQGSPRVSCASASAWRTWRISSPTSPSDWPRRARRSPRSAIATITLGRRRASDLGDPLARFGLTIWRTLSDVRFAVVQIIILAVAGAHRHDDPADPGLRPARQPRRLRDRDGRPASPLRSGLHPGRQRRADDDRRLRGPGLLPHLHGALVHGAPDACSS